MVLPLDAFVEGNEIKATVLSQEEIDGKILCEVQVKDETFFLLKEGEVGKEVSFAIDWTKADFLFGDTRIDHLDLTSSFVATIEMKKEKVVDPESQKAKKKNLYSFRFLDSSFVLEEALAKRVFSAYRGRKAFHVEFKISFAPEAVLMNQGELKATIKSLATYGHRHIATLEVAGKEIYADTLGKEYRVGEEVSIDFDLEKASLVETERDIQIL